MDRIGRVRNLSYDLRPPGGVGVPIILIGEVGNLGAIAPHEEYLEVTVANRNKGYPSAIW